MVTAHIAYPNTRKLRLAALLGLHGCLIEVLQFQWLAVLGLAGYRG
jgi:hypothetical protein